MGDKEESNLEMDDPKEDCPHGEPQDDKAPLWLSLAMLKKKKPKPPGRGFAFIDARGKL